MFLPKGSSDSGKLENIGYDKTLGTHFSQGWVSDFSSRERRDRRGRFSSAGRGLSEWILLSITREVLARQYYCQATGSLTVQRSHGEPKAAIASPGIQPGRPILTQQAASVVWSMKCRHRCSRSQAQKARVSLDRVSDSGDWFESSVAPSSLRSDGEEARNGELNPIRSLK